MAGYTRQDTANNISNGSVIDADDFDAEYNAVEAAFNASTGHKHDGTSGEGAPITKVGPTQNVIVSAINVLPKTTNTLDLGSSSTQFKDAFFDGTVDTDALTVSANATVGGTLGATGVVTASAGVVGNITGNVTGNVTGDLTGDVTGDVTGDLTGNVTGNVTGNTTGNLTGNVTGNVTGSITGNVTGDLTGNADTATVLATARTITVAGDVTATAVSFNGSSDITLTTAQANNSVDLGTHTTGSYVESLVAGTGVTITNNTGESATPTVAIGQAVATTSDVTFNDVVVSGDLTVSGTTTTVNTETLNIADNQIVLNSNETGTPSQNGGIEIERGTSTNKTLVWDESVDKWTVGSETFVAGAFQGAITGAVTGNVNGNVTGNVTGNSSTATTLQTARNIILTGDVTGTASFNGSANATITATIADDSHNHVIGNIDGLQTEIDTKAELAGSGSQVFSASTLNASTVDLGAWTITESGGVLYFNNGSNRMKLDASGNLTVTGNVTAYGTV
jgi:hypothetical protein